MDMGWVAVYGCVQFRLLNLIFICFDLIECLNSGWSYSFWNYSFVNSFISIHLSYNLELKIY